MNIIYTIMLIIGIIGLIITEMLTNKQCTKDTKRQKWNKWKIRF